jgi:hypothetical protein
MRRAVIAGALATPAVVAAVGVAAMSVANTVTGTSLPGMAFVLDALLLALALLAMATVGALLSMRVPANAVGWLILVSAFVLGVEFLAVGYVEQSKSVAAGSWPGTDLAAWLYSNLLSVPVLIMTVAIPLIFPDGRLLSPRWRWFVALLVLTFVGNLLAFGLRKGLIPDTDIENPFGIAGIEPLVELINSTPFQMGSPLVFVGAVTSVLLRYRRGSRMERQQLKWLIAVTALAAIAWSLTTVSAVTGATILTTIGWYGGLLAFVGFPVAIGIAVLRYRLYEIDRIISRTISYGVVTGVLVVVFAAAVLGMQAALEPVTGGSTAAVAASTLVVAALFQPLRRRVQRLVDRHFDRRRYDAERTAAAFAARLRDDVDLASVQGDLLRVVAGSLQPTSLGIWMRGTTA